MNEIIDENWVKNINIGDEIAYYSSYGDNKTWHITKVTGKTATGSLKTTEGDLIKVEWWSSSRNGYSYSPVTDEIRERIVIQNKEKELRKVLSETKFINYTIEQLDFIMNYIKNINDK